MEIRLELAHFTQKTVTSPRETQPGKPPGAYLQGDPSGTHPFYPKKIHFTRGNTAWKASWCSFRGRSIWNSSILPEKDSLHPGKHRLENCLVLISGEIRLELTDFARKRFTSPGETQMESCLVLIFGEMHLELIHFTRKTFTSPGESQPGKLPGAQFRGNPSGTHPFFSKIVYFIWGSPARKAAWFLSPGKSVWNSSIFPENSALQPRALHNPIGGPLPGTHT